MAQLVELANHWIPIVLPLNDPKWLDKFLFHPQTTPMSHIVWPISAVFLYCVGIPLLQRFMTGRKSPPLKWLLVLHNVFLCLTSGLLAILIVAVMVEYRQKGYDLYRIFCGLNFHEQRGLPTFLFYVNYLLKYYELLDSIFLVLKHKPVEFLHGYHHPATLVLTWTQLYDMTGIQWYVILLNLIVHTVMYFYYAMAALHITVPWKKSVTMLQIIQFVLDCIGCFYAFERNRLHQECFGNPRAGVVGCFILTSYLYLFVDFYESVYSSPVKKAKEA